MPSKHTVVVSLDEETERIVNELGGNRSQWIRDAIKWRHGPGGDVEMLEALAEARKRKVRHLELNIRRVVKLLQIEDTAMFAQRTQNAIADLEDLVGY